MIRPIFDTRIFTQTPLKKPNAEATHSPETQSSQTTQSTQTKQSTQTTQSSQTAQSNQTMQSTNTTPVVEEKVNEASTNKSGVHLKLSKDALQGLRDKSSAEYNKIVDNASEKSGKLSEDVINRFKTNTINQAGTAKLAQANSSAQNVLALLR